MAVTNYAFYDTTTTILFIGHTAVLDEAKQKIYIFGGWGVGATNDSDIYILDIQAWSWTRVAPQGFDAESTPPPTIAPPDSNDNNDHEASGQHSDSDKQTIIGAAVGGIIGGAIVLAALCFLLIRRSKRRQKQEKTLSPEDEDIEQHHEKGQQQQEKGGGLIMDEKRNSMNALNSVGTKHMSVNSSINNSAANVPSLMTAEHPTTATTTSEEGGSMSYMIVPPPQSPNEIILQKPNEFTRPITAARGSINSSTLASAGLGSPTVPYVHFSHPTITSSSSSSTIPLAQRVNMAVINSPTSTTTIEKENHHDDDDDDNISPLERLARLQSLPMQVPADRYTLDGTPHHVGPTNKIWFGTLEGDPVALKVFGRREAWERECRALVKLQSATQHVVALQEMLTIGNNNSNLEYVAVLERLESASLSRVMICDVAKGLAACHSHDIAFCDLKPGNIMQKYQQGKYVFKLIDFEASRSIGQECVGLITPRYCPPEVARATTYGIESHGVVASASVDLWSLGCIIYVSVCM